MEVPAEYKNAGLGNLIGGAFGAISQLLLGLSLLIICVGVINLGLAAAHAWQAYVGWQMFNGERVQNGKTAAIVGLVGSVLSFNPISLAGSGFAFMMLGKPEVQGYVEG